MGTWGAQKMFAQQMSSYYPASAKFAACSVLEMFGCRRNHECGGVRVTHMRQSHDISQTSEQVV